MVKKDSPARKAVQVYAQLGAYINLGFQFAATLLACLFLGYWLDARLGTEPVLLIAGVLLGMAVGLYHLYRELMAAEKRRKEDRTG